MNRADTINRLADLGVSRNDMADKSDDYLARRLELRLQDTATLMAMDGLRRQDARVTHYDGTHDPAAEMLKGRGDGLASTEAPSKSLAEFYSTRELAWQQAAFAPTSASAAEKRADEEAELEQLKKSFDGALDAFQGGSR